MAQQQPPQPPQQSRRWPRWVGLLAMGLVGLLGVVLLFSDLEVFFGASGSLFATSATSAASLQHQHHQQHQPLPQSPVVDCAFADLDVFVTAHYGDFPLLSFLVNSLDALLPCRGQVHLLVPAEDKAKIYPWIRDLRGSIVVHSLDRPQTLQSAPWAAVRQWAILRADKYLRPEARFVMVMEADSMLAMPVTCASVFDADGRIYQLELAPERELEDGGMAGRDRARRDQSALALCRRLIAGAACDRLFDAVLPFTAPTAVLPALRTHIVQQLSSDGGGNSDFDMAFAALLTEAPASDFATSFSALSILGEFLRTHHPEAVRRVYCPPFSLDLAADLEASEAAQLCKQFVPGGFHIGQRLIDLMHFPSAPFLGGAEPLALHNTFQGEFANYSVLYSAKTFEVVQDVLFQGLCWQHALQPASSVNLGLTELYRDCSSDLLASVHEELRIYGTDWPLPDLSLLRARFTPDLPGPVCARRFARPTNFK